MKFVAMILTGVAGLVLLPQPSAASDKDKPKDNASQMVDSGTFGVFLNGHRIATETFSIQQTATGSTATSQFKTDEGDKSVQSSELQLTPTGEIRKYEFKELSPGKAQATVAPNNDFLMERSSRSPDEKPEEQPFLLPTSTSIIDDYFFIHREVLVWKYLATACKQDKGLLQCPNQKTQFGTMNPHQRSSQPLSLEFAGRDKVAIRGANQELNKFVLRSEAGDWTMWLDDQFKLQRIVITSDNTEVLRD